MTLTLGEDEVHLPLQIPRVVLETAALLGAERAAVLAGTGIEESLFSSLDSRISFAQYGALIDNARRLVSEPLLGVIAGRNLGSVQLGRFGFALMTSSSLGQALSAWFQHVRVISPAWDPALSIRGTTACLVLRERVFRGPRRAFATELLLGALEGHGRALLGGELPIQAVRVAFARPAHADRYAEFTSVPIEFDAPVTEVDFDATLLSRPIAFADPATHRLAEDLAASEPEEGDLPTRIRGLLLAPLGRPPHASELSTALSMTAEEIRLALREAGTSYRELVEEWRARRAQELATSTQLSVAEMAERVGFRNARSFRRAFRRWTGASPEEARTAAKRAAR